MLDEQPNKRPTPAQQPSDIPSAHRIYGMSDSMPDGMSDGNVGRLSDSYFGFPSDRVGR